MSEIWWANQYAITPDLPGGTRHYDLGVELARKGHRVRIFASDINLALRKRTKLQSEELFRVEERDGLQFIWVNSAEYRKNNWRRAWNMLSFSANLFRVAAKLRLDSQPDVVIGSSPHPFGALAAAQIARQNRSKFFLELRDLWPQALIDMGGLKESHPGVVVMRGIERYLYSRADRFVTLAQGSEAYLREHGVDPSRVLFVPNGVHLGHFQPKSGREEARQRFGFDCFTCVYAGAHGPANALETVIRAAELIPDLPVEFVLVGDGPSKSALQELANQSGGRNVRLLPPVPKGDVPDLLSATDAAIITLKNAKAFAYGVSPNKLFDYMAAARPILCAVPGDMARMVQEAGAGLVVPPEDPAALAAAVRELYSLSDDDRDEMGRNGRTYLTAHFNRETLANRLAAALG